MHPSRVSDLAESSGRKASHWEHVRERYEVGDQFETATRVRWDEALQLLHSANGVLSGGVSTTVEQEPGRPRVAVFAMSQAGWGESLRIGLSMPAARLLLRCCAGALE